ncbi:unnamed protein product [Peniophora sp. CBMAI 1063]|nr:unnamed protein product [Peniophora sp. CBMAI 1063]
MLSSQSQSLSQAGSVPAQRRIIRCVESYFLTSNGDIFGLPAAFLKARVPIISDMLSLPAVPGQTAEGQSPENPITMPMVSTEQLQTLSDFCFMPRDCLKGNFNHLVMLLHTSDALGCDGAHTYALDELPKCKEWTLVQQLRLAVAYNIRPWLVSSFKALIRRPASDITVEECLMLGFKILHDLDLARDEVDKHRRR